MWEQDYEEKILDYWKKDNSFLKLRRKNEGNKTWSFIDGPVTANNPLGVHHAWGRTYKDLFQRYKAMQGYDERYQNGFDCQGLWVEVEVEKELGFKNKKDIEKYGIEKFVEKCRKRVLKYSKIQTDQSIRLGQWMDWDHSYYTMSDENNYDIWAFLKKVWEKGWLYKGRDVVPWCPRCGTAISQHEISTEEYKEFIHKTVFVKFKLTGSLHTYFIAWTTTPWTLVANVALAVHPDLIYAKVKDKSGSFYILLKSKADLVPNGKVIETFPGKKLEGMTYDGIFDELPKVQEEMRNHQHKVVLWDEVSEDEGTGIVHIAPGCGPEDYQLSKDLQLAVIDPTDKDSKYKDGFGKFSGNFVYQSNNDVFDNLSRKGLIFKIEDYKHKYPVCWRCGTELIFRLVDEWYISVDKVREGLIESAKQIKWIPPFGLDRELDWLRNMDDWLISKKRYWGLALPIYECPECNHFEVIGSREELKERAVEGWKEFDGHSPHRPWVDNVKIKCSKCGHIMSRIPDVGTPWLDAGIVPFSTLKYFHDKKYWEKWFPADFVCESFPGQFRNWFYAILIMSQVLEAKPPTKTVFGYATVLDEKGEEMHKSKGNAIWLDDALEKMGADVMRWIYAKQNPALNLKFGYKLADETRKRLLILWNSYVFFKTYVSKEEIKGMSWKDITRPKYALDRWILSRFHKLIKQTTDALDNYRPSFAATSIEDFFINDFSLWYIRRSRDRLSKSNNEEGKIASAQTFYYILVNLIALLSPFIPFLTERIYLDLKKDDMPSSIHLFDWPQFKSGFIDNELEEEMKNTRNIITQALAQRAEHHIKTRQPLSVLYLKNKKLIWSGDINDEEEILDLIKKEVNVKEVIFDSGIQKDTQLETTITPQLKEEGILRDFVRLVQRLRKTAGYTPRDRICIAFKAPRESSVAKTLLNHQDYIIDKTKAKGLSLLERSLQFAKKVKLDEEELVISINKC